MVVVYLSSPKYGGWNANVMFEFGYRQRSQKPLILLKDDTANGQPYSLPFDISDYRYVDIPEDDCTDCGSYVRRIQELLKVPTVDPWRHSYPAAILELEGGKVKIAEETGDLKQLFDVPHVLGKDLQSDILPHLRDCMPQAQLQAFEDQQSKLIGKIMMSAYKDVHATIPMLFTQHRTSCGRAFLPVIASYSNVDNVLRLNVIYVEVTGALTKHADGYFYCDLVGQPLVEPPAADQKMIPMKAPAPH